MTPDILIRALAARVAQAHEDAPVVRVDVAVDRRRWAALYENGVVRAASHEAAPPADFLLRLAPGRRVEDLDTPYQRHIMPAALSRLRERRMRVQSA